MRKSLGGSTFLEATETKIVANALLTVHDRYEALLSPPGDSETLERGLEKARSTTFAVKVARTGWKSEECCEEQGYWFGAAPCCKPSTVPFRDFDNTIQNKLLEGYIHPISSLVQVQSSMLLY